MRKELQQLFMTIFLPPSSSSECITNALLMSFVYFYLESLCCEKLKLRVRSFNIIIHHCNFPYKFEKKNVDLRSETHVSYVIYIIEHFVGFFAETKEPWMFFMNNSFSQESNWSGGQFVALLPLPDGNL